jgi:hypothetical protein
LANSNSQSGKPDDPKTMKDSVVLKVRNLQVSYYTDAGRARALDGVDLTLCAGEKLGPLASRPGRDDGFGDDAHDQARAE